MIDNAVMKMDQQYLSTQFHNPDQNPINCVYCKILLSACDDHRDSLDSPADNPEAESCGPGAGLVSSRIVKPLTQLAGCSRARAWMPESGRENETNYGGSTSDNPAIM